MAAFQKSINAYNIGKIFKDGKAASKKVRTKTKSMPLKTRLCASFEDTCTANHHQYGLHLSGPEKVAYIDCLSLAPQVEAHVGQPDKIHHG